MKLLIMFLFANDCVDRVSLHPTSAFLCTCFAFVLSLIKTKSTLNNFLTQKQKVISQNRIELFQNCDLLQFWFPVSLAKNALHMFTHSFRMHHIVMLQGIRLYREERTIEI